MTTVLGEHGDVVHALLLHPSSDEDPNFGSRVLAASQQTHTCEEGPSSQCEGRDGSCNNLFLDRQSSYVQLKSPVIGHVSTSKFKEINKQYLKVEGLATTSKKRYT